MATLLELRQLYGNSEMRNKVAPSIAITANKIMIGVDTVAPFSQAAGAHDLRLVWAKENFGNTAGQAAKFWEVILAKNSAATIEQIIGASDAAIKSNVDESVDLFAGVIS